MRHLWEWTTLAENRWTHIGRKLTIMIEQVEKSLEPSRALKRDGTSTFLLSQPCRKVPRALTGGSGEV
jgi:hypothetical protein